MLHGLWHALWYLSSALAGWAALELLSYVLEYSRRQRLGDIPVPSPAVERERVQGMMQRILDLHETMDAKAYLESWFDGAPFDTIKRDNIREFAAYGIHFKRVEELTPEEREGLDDYLERAEAASGTKFAPGRTEGLHFLAHLWEPVRSMHTPLCVRAGAHVMRLATSGLLRLSGFRPHDYQGFRYWLRPAAAAAPLSPVQVTPAGASATPHGVVVSADRHQVLPRALPPPSRPRQPLAGKELERGDPESLDRESSNGGRGRGREQEREGGSSDSEEWTYVERGEVATSGGEGREAGRGEGGRPRTPEERGSAGPILFLHGVGLGLTPYIRFVADLMLACPHRPCVLLEMPHVSLGLAQPSTHTDAVADAALGILARHGWDRAAILAHSYGTFVTSRLVQRHPEKIEAMALIDPVCMLCVYPQLLANFVYKPVSGPWGGNPFTAVIDAIRYVFSRDPTIAQTFCRQFVWHRESLFPEDLPRHALLVLAGLDDLVPSALIRARLTQIGSPAGVEYAAHITHGGFLFEPRWRQRVVQRIAETFRQAEAEGAAKP